MLRFDLPPVHANVVRVDAFITFSVCCLALLGFPWLVPVLTLQGLIRGFIGHYRCPSHRLLSGWMQRHGWAGKKENAGAKMFANKLLFIASSVAIILWVVGSSMWKVPITVLVVFSFLEWAFSFCAACWAYTFWYQLFPPKSS